MPTSDGCQFCGCDGCSDCSGHSWRECSCKPSSIPFDPKPGDVLIVRQTNTGHKIAYWEFETPDGVKVQKPMSTPIDDPFTDPDLIPGVDYFTDPPRIVD
jgi:hypothetical protein